MAIVTIYGRQYWTAGDFSSAADYQSTAFNGGDPPISGYPELAAMENMQRVEGAGPAGEDIADAISTPDYDVAGIVLGGFGPLAHGQYDVRGIGGGTYVEWWQKFSRGSGSWTVAQALGLTHGNIDGTDDALQSADLWLYLTMEQDAGAAFTWHLRYDYGGDVDVNGASDTMDDAWHRMKVYVRPATLDPGGLTTQADGIIKVWVDDVPVIEVVNAQMFVNSAASASDSGYYSKAIWHGFYDMPGGVTGTWVYYDTEDAGSEGGGGGGGGGEETVPEVFDCETDEGGNGRGGALQLLLVDTGAGSPILSDYPVPGGVTATVLAQPHAAPSSFTATAQAGGTSIPQTLHYAIATLHDGVISELSAVQSVVIADATSRVQLSWSGLAAGADYVRVFRGADATFLQYDKYRVTGYPYAESDVLASETGVLDLYPGYNTRGEPPTPDAADPHWDLVYRQNRGYMVSSLWDDGTESACSAPAEAQLWPRNAPLSVQVSWSAAGAGPTGTTLVGYRVRRLSQLYSFEPGLTRQWDFDTTVLSFIDPNTDTTAVSACSTVSGGKPVYCAAGHWLKAIRAVYVFKPHPVTGEMAHILMVEGVDYTQEVREVNGNRYHCVIFEEQQRSDMCQWYDVTADVDGVETNADGTGELLTNIDDIFEHILFNVIFNTYRSSVGPYAPSGGKWFYDVPYSPGLIDRASIAAARAVGVIRFPESGYPGGGMLVAHINARQLIHDLLVSADLMFYQHNGVWFTKRFDPNVVRSTLPQIGPADDIFRESFEPFLLTEKQINLIPFFGGPIGGNPDNGWLASGEIQDDEAIDLYRRVIISDPVYLLWTQSSLAAYDIITQYLKRLRFPPIGATFQAVINRYSLPPGSLVRVSHPDGLGPTGWTDRVCMVLSNELDFDALTCAMTVRDIDNLIAA